MPNTMPQSTSPTKIPASPTHRRAVSLDAFEASFATTFPSDFASPEENETSNKKEYYDPFSSFGTTSASADGPSLGVINFDSPERPAVVSRNSSWEEDALMTVSSSESYSASPRRRPHDDDASSGGDQPKRPEKAPSAEAHAKYVNAMQPRPTSSPPKEPSASQDHQLGPSLLLQRIQHRRKQKKLNRQQSEP
jgi:hypothetical protein